MRRYVGWASGVDVVGDGESVAVVWTKKGVVGEECRLERAAEAAGSPCRTPSDDAKGARTRPAGLYSSVDNEWVLEEIVSLEEQEDSDCPAREIGRVWADCWRALLPTVAVQSDERRDRQLLLGCETK